MPYWKSLQATHPIFLCHCIHSIFLCVGGYYIRIVPSYVILVIIQLQKRANCKKEEKTFTISTILDGEAK